MQATRWVNLWVKVSLLGVMLAMAKGPALAQAVYGQLIGTVTDSTGAIIPNATIVVTDVTKGSSVTAQSNASGNYTIEHLIPDTYSIRVSSPNFKNFEATNVLVNADASPKIDATLSAGSAGDTVTVNADEVPSLKTDRADVSTIFSGKEFVDLPIPGRNFTGLQLLLPGAQQLGFTHAASENPQGSLQIEVDGQAFAGTSFQLDGTDNQEPILGIIVVNPNAEALSESKITTQNYDAEFGKAVSSVITAQTKSGTNKFHGSAFDYRQSNAQLARDPFTQSATAPFPVGLRNQFGGSIGGPIIKDRLFFFGDYQGTRQKTGIGVQQTVPTSLLTRSCLAGACDFSEYANALAPKNAAGAPIPLLYHTVNGVRTPYANNIIPAADLSPQGLALLRLLQPYAPNTINGSTTSGLAQNYSASGIGGFNADQWDVRGDYTLNDKTHAFGRFSRFTDTLTGTTVFGQAGGAGFGIGNFGGTSQGANDSGAIGVDAALNSKLVTDVRLGYFRYNITTSKYDQNTPLANQLGIPGLNTGAAITNGAPLFTLTEVGGFGAPDGIASRGPKYGSGLNANRCNCPLTEREDQYQIANNWTKTIGNHAVKFGTDLRYARNLRVPSDSNRTGQLNFGTGPTGDGVNNTGLGFASLLTGQVTSLSRYVSTSTNAKEFQKRTFFYVQNTWRTTPKLTLNLGLRYEVYFPETVNGRSNGAVLNLATGYLQVAGVGGIQTNMDQQRPSNTYNPRVGIAYQANSRTVIRAGYGRSFDIGVFGSIFGFAATQNLPVLANQSLSGPGGDNTTDTTPAFTLANGPQAYAFPTVPGNGLLPSQGYSSNSRSRPTTLRLPTLDAWNAAIQQSLTPTLSFTVAYAANKGTHTFGDNSGNATNPNEAAIVLPAAYSVTGQQLHYDPKVSATANPQSIGGKVVTGINPDGGTANNTYLRRYYGGKLPACSDPAYNADVATGQPAHNAPNGGCGWNQGITYLSDDLDTHYNALQLTLTKQFAHGYSLNANYAWQKSINEQTGYSTWSRPAVRGRDSSLRQQQVIVYGLFDLPFGHNKQFLSHTNRVIDQIVSGFQISPVVNYSSGLPYTLSAQSGNWVPGSVPRYINGDPKRLQRHVTGFPGGPSGLRFYDPVNLNNGVFSLPNVDQIGTVGRNSAFGPLFFNTDIALQKDFAIREAVILQLRADGYNAFNHINWGTPNGNVDQGGSISSGAYPNNTSNPRQLQFSGRIQF